MIQFSVCLFCCCFCFVFVFFGGGGGRVFVCVYFEIRCAGYGASLAEQTLVTCLADKTASTYYLELFFNCSNDMHTHKHSAVESLEMFFL